jgi:hypothetical protein
MDKLPDFFSVVNRNIEKLAIEGCVFQPIVSQYISDLQFGKINMVQGFGGHDGPQDQGISGFQLFYVPAGDQDSHTLLGNVQYKCRDRLLGLIGKVDIGRDIILYGKQDSLGFSFIQIVWIHETCLNYNSRTRKENQADVKFSSVS